jgi:YD repeat-containing protein
MTLKKTIAVLAVLAGIALGGSIFYAGVAGASTPSSGGVTYVYDDLNRLTEVDFEDGTLIKYAYDEIGNPTGKSYCGSESFTVTATSGTGGTVSPSSASVTCGGSQTFTITPDTNYYVSDVLVDGADQGAITSYTFSSVAASHTISATFAIDTYTITTSAGSNGSISPAGATVDYNGSQTFTITPSSGYCVTHVLVDGADQGAVTSYTFSNVTATHTISATFAVATYTITTSPGANGSISPASATVNYNGSQTFTITPDTGYHVADVLVDGADQGAITSYTFSSVTATHTISAAFAINTYTVTPSAATGGSIGPSTAQTVNYDGTTSFTVTPNTGYSIGSVTGCGGTLSGSTYTTGPITADCSVSAAFAANTYTITASAGVNGSISPSEASVINQGAGATYTITPISSQVNVSNVVVDGVSQGAITSYTFSDVTANHTISATFIVIAGAASWGTNGTYYWTATFTGNITASNWGGGGGGGAGKSPNGGGGGGSGYYATSTYAVTYGVQYTITVGAGGTQGTHGTYGGTGGAGNASYFNGAIGASGGNGGESTGSTGGTGGTGGTNGANGTMYLFGGGGYGGAGGTAPDGGGAGGAGGANNNAVGHVGSGPGGGGAGGGCSNKHGGAGADGGVYISWAAQ